MIDADALPAPRFARLQLFGDATWSPKGLRVDFGAVRIQFPRERLLALARERFPGVPDVDLEVVLDGLLASPPQEAA